MRWFFLFRLITILFPELELKLIAWLLYCIPSALSIYITRPLDSSLMICCIKKSQKTHFFQIPWKGWLATSRLTLQQDVSALKYPLNENLLGKFVLTYLHTLAVTKYCKAIIFLVLLMVFKYIVDAVFGPLLLSYCRYL